MLGAVAGTEAEIVLGHWRGPSADMYAGRDLRRRCRRSAHRTRANASKLPPPRASRPVAIVVDPGIGFGKKPDQNWAVLRGLARIVGAGHRVLVGTSRKGFLAQALGGADVTESRRDLATAVTSAFAAQAGVWAVRVHDVAATRDALAITREWEGDDRWTSWTRSR